MTSPADWTRRIAETWAAADQLGDEELVRRIDALAAERPGDPRAAAERGGARDSTGREAEAAVLYQQALDGGLEEPERSRVVIQQASTLRNLDRHEESIALLRDHFRERRDHELAPAADAFLALSLATSGREREAVALLLRTLEPTLPRYNRSVRRYADLLERGELGPAAAADGAR